VISLGDALLDRDKVVYKFLFVDDDAFAVAVVGIARIARMQHEMKKHRE
jgi:hypothetical protein